MEAEGVSESHHLPVLYDEVLTWLASERSGALVFDGTLGGGSHSEGLLEALDACILLGVDRDPLAIQRCRRRLAPYSKRCRLEEASFGQLEAFVDGLSEETLSALSLSRNEDGCLKFDRMLLDLGISSDQLDAPERGFSFSSDGPLDMRMNQNSGQSAADILNSATAEELARLFRRGGMGPGSSALSREIVSSRPIESTKEFADLCVSVLRRGKLQRLARSGHHPATVPFQALRIAVNEEVESLKQFLRVALNYLAPDGRLAIISFHSLEDKLVTQAMRRWSQADPAARALPGPDSREGRLLTKKAITASEEELSRNPRARSARLRVFERIAAPTMEVQ